jgi:hypothetical protein
MRRSVTALIIVEGIHDPIFGEHVRTKITDALARVSPPPTMAKIIFADENGPKGGIDTRCTIVFHVPRRRELSVTELGDSLEVAFEAAYDALAVSVSRTASRRRELVRRPKKYFLAKRLLAAEATPEVAEAPAETARPKRTRRRRVA